MLAVLVLVLLLWIAQLPAAMPEADPRGTAQPRLSAAATGTATPSGPASTAAPNVLPTAKPRSLALLSNDSTLIRVRRGGLTLEVRVPRTRLVPGELMQVDASLRNDAPPIQTGGLEITLQNNVRHSVDFLSAWGWNHFNRLQSDLGLATGRRVSDTLILQTPAVERDTRYTRLVWSDFSLASDSSQLPGWGRWIESGSLPIEVIPNAAARSLIGN